MENNKQTEEELFWWDNKNIQKLWIIGDTLRFEIFTDRQTYGWEVKGIYKTEEEAIKNCTNVNWFICPVPIGVMIGNIIPKELYFPLKETKEESYKNWLIYKENNYSFKRLDFKESEKEIKLTPYLSENIFDDIELIESTEEITQLSLLNIILGKNKFMDSPKQYGISNYGQ